MTILQQFADNTKQFGKQALLMGSVALGTMLPTRQANAQSKADVPYDRQHNGYFYFVGGGHESANSVYKNGGYLNIGGQVPLFSKRTKLRGEYNYFFKDPNKVSYGFPFHGYNRTGSAGYTFIPSRARVLAGVGTDQNSNLEINLLAGLEAYPGAVRNWVATSSFITRAEVGIALLPKTTPINISVGAYAEYTIYNNNFHHNFRPDRDASMATGIRAVFTHHPSRR